MDTSDGDPRADQRLAGAPPSVGFLAGSGEMNALIHAHDWSSTLGPPHTWSQSLRTVMRLLLTTYHPVLMFWGPGDTCVYNDAFAALLGPEQHPVMLGMPARRMWHDNWDVVGPQLQAVKAGKGATWYEDQCIPMVRHGELKETFWSYSYSPIDDDTAPAGIGGVLVVCQETTQRIIVQRTQACRLQLEAALRDLEDPVEIMRVSTTILGEFLCASRCGYGEVDRNGESLIIRADCAQGASPYFPDRIPLADFGPTFIARHASGKVVPIEDPRVIDLVRRQGHVFATPAEAESGLAVPLIRNGRMVAALYVYRSGQLRWNPQYEVLIAEVAQRTLAAVERARAAIERDRVTAALRDSEARYRSLVEASAAIVWEMPASGEFATPQPGWSAYTGQTFDELKGWGWLDAVHPEDQDLAAEVIGHAFEARSNYELEYRLRGSDGTYLPMHARGIAVLNHDGSLHGWIGINSDRSMSSAPPERQQQESDPNDLSGVSQHVTWTATPDGKLQRLSRRWSDWTGLRDSPDSWIQALHPEERELVIATLRQATSNGTPYDMEHRIRRANGEYRWVHARAQPHRDAAGRILQWSGTMEDIHEWLINHDIHLDHEQRARDVPPAQQPGMARD